MRKFLFSILLLISFWVNAQVYHPLVDSDAVWNVETRYCECYNCWYHVDGYKYFLSGDSLIQGLNYILLKYQPTYFCNLYDCISLDIQSVVIDTTSLPILVGALREDSSHKVWYNDFTLDSLFLLYDFAVEVGDTLNWNWVTLSISSIDSVQLLNGEWRKRFNLNGNFPAESLIEGIGSTLGLLSPLYPPNFFVYGDYHLTCYHNNGEWLFDGTSSGLVSYVSCDVIDVIGKIMDENFNFYVFPNPATNFLSINFSSRNFSSAQIKIFDVLGRNLFTDEIKSNQPLQISTEKFSGSNMLFCELWQEGKLISVKKVLLQR